MKLMVQSYGSGAYNAEEEETDFLHYAPTHGFDESAEVTITLSDSTGLLAQKYIVDLKKALAGGVADDGGAETDETTETNSAAANDMTLLPAAPAENDAYYFGFDEEVGGFSLNVGTAGTEGAGAGWTITWEYSKGADAWDALAGVTDGTDKFLNAGINNITWTLPGDWATDEVGSISGKYWVRARVSAFASIGVQPLGTQAWYDKVWLGPGKVTIEDPDETDIFYGRIMKAEATADERTRTLTLYCQDWLSQLDEKQITYDMREDLDSDDDTGKQGLRESTLHADADNATIIDVAYNDGGGPDKYYLYDDARSWDADEFNGMYVVLSNKMAGKKKWRFYPYDSSDSGGITYTDDVEVLWVDDNGTEVAFDNADFTLDYVFRIYLGHDTPSNFYVHSSITGGRVFARWMVTDAGVGNHSHVQIDDKTDGWLEFALLEEDDHFKRTTWEVTPTDLSKIIDANGIATVRFDMDRVGGNTTISLTFLYIEIDTETTGYSTAILINDTLDLNAHGGKVNCLEVGTDMTAAATRVWEAVPYCIAKLIFKHIDSAEGGTLITGGDDLVTLTCAATIEHTSGISTRQYVGKTRLQIAKDLARQDRAHLWIPLGSTTVTYKSTFNDGAPETLTDTDVNSWQSTRDYATLANEATVYGMRIGDNRLSSTYTDTTSEATYGATRTKVTSDTGLVSEYDTLARATALVNQYKDIQQILNCTIRGNTATAAHGKTLVLGDEVEITSTHLGLSSAVYIVQRWAYDSRSNMTTLLLHPRVSEVGLQKDERPSFEMVMQANRRGTADRYIPEPPTHEVA